MTLRNSILVWFAASLLIEVFSSVVLLMRLRSSGVKVSFFWCGFPGYLERLYGQWCQSHGRSGAAMLLFRRASQANVIIAAVVAIPFLTGASGKP